MGLAAYAAVAAVVAIGSAASSANQQSISRKRAVNAQAENKRLQEENTAALQALEAKPEKAMPTADDQSQRRHRRRSIARQMKGGGRQSTILTSDGGQGPGLGG